MWQRSDSPWCIAALAALAYGLFVLARLAYFSGDPSVFVVAGDRITDRDVAGHHLRILWSSYGFDGQFFYRLALDPFTAERTAHGIWLDVPAYRQQRILYPLFVWAVSGGQPESIPAALVAVNWAALIVIGWCAGRLAQTGGRHAAVGMLLAFYPGFLHSLSRDLSEIVELAFVLSAVVLLRLRRPATAAVALALGLLARETALLAAVGVACVAVAQRACVRDRDSLPLWAAVFPLTVWSLWQLVLLTRWGVVPFLSAPNNLGWPFVAVGGVVMEWVRGAQPYDRFRLRLVGYLAAMALAAAVSLRRSHARPYDKVSWVLYAVLAVVASRPVWEEDWGFMRGTAGLCVFSGVILLGARRAELPWFAAAATVMAWGIVALTLIGRL